MANRKTWFNKGFTLMELLVVIMILGLLSTIGLGAFRSAQAKSRDARRKAELANVAKALEMYYNDHKAYPDEADLPARGGVFTDGNTDYMIKFPGDPGGGTYLYTKLSDKEYVLFARLENILDKDAAKIINGGSEVPAGYTGYTCGSGLCNYAQSSQNINADTDFAKEAL